MDEGIVGFNTPKSVMHEAYSVGIISDEKKWLDLISDRNTTPHIYSEDVANNIYANIERVYCKLFESLIDKLS